MLSKFMKAIDKQLLNITKISDVMVKMFTSSCVLVRLPSDFDVITLVHLMSLIVNPNN
jgi:hypothetical protein